MTRVTPPYLTFRFTRFLFFTTWTISLIPFLENYILFLKLNLYLSVRNYLIKIKIPHIRISFLTTTTVCDYLPCHASFGKHSKFGFIILSVLKNIAHLEK